MPELEGLTPAEVQELAAQAGINRPITAVRVVGNRVELHQLGGTVTSFNRSDHTTIPSSHTGSPQGDTSADPLAGLTVAQLHYIAQELNLTGYHKLKKVELRKLLQEGFTTEQLVEVTQS